MLWNWKYKEHRISKIKPCELRGVFHLLPPWLCLKIQSSQTFIILVISTSVWCSRMWVSMRFYSLTLQWNSDSSSSSITKLSLSVVVVGDHCFICARHSVTDSPTNQLVVLTSVHVANVVWPQVSRRNTHFRTLVPHFVYQSTYCVFCMRLSAPGHDCSIHIH